MSETYLGIIEGFYGQSYLTAEREYLYDFCARHGYQFYIYAPKADTQLRDHWEAPITPEYQQQLKSMSEAAHARGLDFGIALSPLHLTSAFEEKKDLMLERIAALCAHSHCDIFCLLFDDMVKDSEHVGTIQNSIIRTVEKNLPAHVKHFIVCPSYYTDDPVLDRLFGQRPVEYFPQFTQDLPERVEIFWTGPKVLSEDLTPDYLEQVTAMLGRKPFIWDNYPVNDGKKLCQYLYLNKFNGRRHLKGAATGHAINPMVQPLLSTLAAVTLPLIYADKRTEEINAAFLKQARELFGAATSMIIKYDNFNLLTRTGREQMSASDRIRFLEFCRMDQKPALDELADFIKGSMRFDQSIVAGGHQIGN